MKIELERYYPHPLQAVWEALTDARAIRQWWVDTDFEPRVGKEFFYRDRPQGSWDGVVRGKVLEAEAPRRVKFSWVGDGHETTVTYELSATADGGTRLVLRHEGFRGLKGLFLFGMLRFGWGGYLKKDLPALAGHIAAHGFARPFPGPSKATRVGVAASAG